nr:sigma-70 family RNA polymerase sigma factor [Sphingomonas sp. CARO-RG-8B-R24-01]
MVQFRFSTKDGGRSPDIRITNGSSLCRRGVWAHHVSKGIREARNTPARIRTGEDATERWPEGELARRRHMAVWVAREIMPHEGRVRAWFQRARLSPEDIDDVIQEAYCRIAMLKAVDHIDSPAAYFFSIARNLLLRRLKRQRIVSFEAFAEIEAYRDDATPSPEEQAGSHLAYDRMMELIANLPARCRRIVELRKIEGWSHREIADHLGMTEKAVEKQIWVGVRAVRDAWNLAERRAGMRLDLAEHGARSQR